MRGNTNPVGGSPPPERSAGDLTHAMVHLDESTIAGNVGRDLAFAARSRRTSVDAAIRFLSSSGAKIQKLAWVTEFIRIHRIL